MGRPSFLDSLFPASLSALLCLLSLLPWFSRPVIFFCNSNTHRVTFNALDESL